MPSTTVGVSSGRATRPATACSRRRSATPTTVARAGAHNAGRAVAVGVPAAASGRRGGVRVYSVSGFVTVNDMSMSTPEAALTTMKTVLAGTPATSSAASATERLMAVQSRE